MAPAVGRKQPWNVLDNTGKLMLSGLTILIIAMMSSTYLGPGAFVMGIVVFITFGTAAVYLPETPSGRPICLSCGRILKVKDKCGVCGANQIVRVTEVQLIAVASILLLIGVIFLGAAGAYSETRIAVIGDLRESDNFRQTRIIGNIVDLIDYYPEKYDDTGTIRMVVNDGTGDISVKIVPNISKYFIETGYIPGFGDTVDCEGALFVGDEGYMQLKVRDKNLFKIVETSGLNLTLEELLQSEKTDYDLGAKVSVEGQIQGKFYIDCFAWILDLGDQEGRSVSVFIPDTITLLTGELDMDALYLSQVIVTGGLEWYESGQSWEIIPGSVLDIEIINPYTGDDYTILTVKELLANASAYQNKFVQLDDVTVEWYYASYLYSVSDSTTYDEIAIFVDYDANTSASFGLDDKMSVRGWVTFYDENNNNVPDEGEWEIKIRELSSDYGLTIEDLGGA